jgi:hypothetical protein
MPQQQPMGPGDHLTPKSGTNFLFMVAYAHSICLTVFLRSGFGSEAFYGFTGPIAFVMIVLAAGEDKTGIMGKYFFAWLFAIAFQRMLTIGNKRRGVIPFSGYNGFPKVAMQLFRCKTETKARTLEPVICLTVGIGLYQVSQVAGVFVLAGVASLTIIEGSLRRIDQRKVQHMRDARIQAERMSAMYKGHEF